MKMTRSRAWTYAAMLAISSLAHAASVAFDVPSDKATPSLYRFMEQSGVQVHFSELDLVDVRTRAVAGHQEPLKALEAMMEGTGLKVIVVGDGSYTVARYTTIEDVARMDRIDVTATRARPFVDGNMDIPRTENDVQPYTILTAAAIEKSGALNVEDFLKQHLTSNAVFLSNGQNAVSQRGNLSTVNLRGLGADKTLVLVDGRRVAGVTLAGTGRGESLQPDLNGLPLSAIERIEILPTSAAGIYGANAIGGVINIVTKKQYSGGEVSVSYDNTWNTDAPKRTAGFNYGFSLEGGKTQARVSASWTESTSLLLEERADLFRANLAKIKANNPGILSSSYSPFLGSLPNILQQDYDQDFLTLKNGTVIKSNQTYVGADISPTSSASALYASLAANGGSWNYDLPKSTQTPTGLLRPYGVEPTSKAFSASVRRQMTPWLELFAEANYNATSTWSIYSPLSSSLSVSATAPTNPFTTDVAVRIPDATAIPNTTDSDMLMATFGGRVSLPADWEGTFDYTYSQNTLDTLYNLPDFGAIYDDLDSGALNPFVNTLRYPLNLQKYLYAELSHSKSSLHAFDFRGSGPLPSLPWGTPNLTVGYEHRIAKSHNNTYTSNSPTYGYIIHYFPKQADTDSIYGETLVPLIKKNVLPGLHSLEFQAAGRVEQYKVDTGSPYFKEYPDHPNLNGYATPTVNGAPYFSSASYSSKNYTVGLKYQPVRDVSLRFSKGTAFLTPAPSQLVKNQEKSSYTTNVVDPLTNKTVAVYTLSGGNPDLKPQTSESLNGGVIWEPTFPMLIGLRLNAEYFKTTQHDYISSLSAQAIVTQEALYPGRVVRDSTGRITLVDTSSLNLYELRNEGFDLGLSYTRRTSVGTLTVDSNHSIATHIQTQYSFNSPMYDSVGFPAEGGATKYKSNLSLSWNYRAWTAGWTTRFFDSYKQYGAAGGPYSTQYLKGKSYYYYVGAQGSETIPSQTYHDVFFSYNLGVRNSGSGSKLSRVTNGILSGVSIQVGVRNVFDKIPPFDAYQDTSYYLSPYGDIRLRSYWLTLKKTF